MRLVKRIDEMPVEEWAASLAGFVRALRRRSARRKLSVLMGAAWCAAMFLAADNALWRQDERHPAPLVGAFLSPAAAGLESAAAEAQPERLNVRAMGDSSGLMRDIQDALSAQGYYDGERDGILNADTSAAIEAFERDRGLPATGRPGVGLLASLTEERTSPAAAPIGQSGTAVLDGLSTPAELQARLNELGYGPLTVDGVFGPRTHAAYQRLVRAAAIESDVADATLTRILAGTAQ